MALAYGLVLAALVTALGPVSGGHFHFTVTVSLAVIRRFPSRYVSIYVIAQAIGAVLGALATWPPSATRRLGDSATRQSSTATWD